MSSRAFSVLATFLTRPLVLHYPLAAVLNVQLMLEANLSQVTLPFTFTLSAELPAPQPFANTGIPWTQWTAIFGDQPLHFSVTEQCVKLSIGQLPSFVLWAQSVEETSYVPFISKLKRTASAVQVPRIPSPIKTPSLPCIDSPLDSDSDSESDSASSSFSFSSSSSDSMTSVSSRSSSPSCKDSTTPSKDPVALPPSVPITPRHLPRKQPRVVIDCTKKDSTKYLYQGGSTNVITGGVMLGKSAQPKPAPAQSGKPRRKLVLLGPESNDWRRRD